MKMNWSIGGGYTWFLYDNEGIMKSKKNFTSVQKAIDAMKEYAKSHGIEIIPTNNPGISHLFDNQRIEDK